MLDGRRSASTFRWRCTAALLFMVMVVLLCSGAIVSRELVTSFNVKLQASTEKWLVEVID